MPVLERLRGTRVVAEPAAIDALVAAWPASVVPIRSAPDDVFAIGIDAAEVDDPHAIVEDERGFVGGWCTLAEVAPHAEWSMPSARPALAQGSIAGVPAKIAWLPDGRAWIVTHAAYAAELVARLR